MAEETIHQNGENGRKLYEVVSDRLTEMIARGEFRPGDRLPPERKLMEMFSVGRPAIREALLVLRNAGLVSIHNGRRAEVRRPDASTFLSNATLTVQSMLEEPGSLADFFFARMFFEKALARHAALHAQTEDIRALKEALEESGAALGDRDRYEQADLAFHRVLFSIPGNPLFVAIHRAFDAWLIDRWRQLDRPLSRDRDSHEGHKAIFEAIIMRDADAAEAAMESHLSLAWTFWRDRLVGKEPA